MSAMSCRSEDSSGKAQLFRAGSELWLQNKVPCQ